MKITEENVISLRTALFTDDGLLGTLVLTPPIPDRRPDGRLHRDICWVYKRHRPLTDVPKGDYKKHQFDFVLKNMKPLKVSPHPKLSFLWSENGYSVALIVDGEPMGFIAEDKFNGYSKASKNSQVMNMWDEDLFQKTFKA